MNMLDMKVLHGIVKKLSQDTNLAERVTEEYHAIAGLIFDKQRLDALRSKEDARHKEAMDEIHRHERDLKSRCSHPSTTYYETCKGNKMCDICRSILG